PRPRLIEKKVSQEKRRAVRTAERELFERTVSDEDAARRSLDEGEVLHHAAILCVRSRAVSYQGPDSSKIRSMFASIAGRYDRANTILSAGVHHRWRREAMRWSGAREGESVLDCATGTGDLAIRFKNAVGSGRVVGT